MIIDLGCGQRKMPGSIGVDYVKFDGVDVVHDLNKHPLPFEDGVADLVSCIEVIEHLDHPADFLREVARILKPHGMLIISTNNRKSLINQLFKSYEFKGHDSLLDINTFKTILEIWFDIVDFKVLPYTQQDDQYRTIFYHVAKPFRRMLNAGLPEELRERMFATVVKRDVTVSKV